MAKNTPRKTAVSLIAVLGTISLICVPVKAETICRVTDPTGTPLNVRDKPNGKIITTLENGKQVEILNINYDNQGRPWVLITTSSKGENVVSGWVFREFISCYKK